jgi:CPA2 family monovalent cation:H+ antiporter-2
MASPHDASLIMTLAVGFAGAFVGGAVAQKLRLPPLVGYLLAGVAVGPFTPGPVADGALASELAEVGVILLMFGVGLHFSLADLWAVRRIAVPGAIAQIAIATALGAGLATLWGWSFGAGLVFGLALSCASTVVLLRALGERGMIDTLDGRIAVGWLIVEDLAMVLALVLLPALAGPLGASPEVVAAHAPGAVGLWGEVALTLGKVALFVGFMMIAGSRIFPAMLGHVARSGSRELFTLAVLATSLGVAYVAARVFDVSFALGAFVAGVVVAGSSLRHRVAEDTLPLQDAFTVLFFVSVGMLFDPAILRETPGMLLATVAVIVVGKSIAALAIVRLFRYPAGTALTVAAALAQIGEFSFIIAELGLGLGILPPEGRSLILAGAIVSITFNPFVFAGAFELWQRVGPRLDRAPAEEPPAALAVAWLEDHAIVVGGGRVGRVVADALARADVPHLVVEANPEVVDQLRAAGKTVLTGDATTPAVLAQAGLATARLLVVALPSPIDTRAIVASARRLNPALRIVARTHSDEERAYLEAHDVDRAVTGETELARAMAHHALQSARPDEPLRPRDLEGPVG